MCCCPGLGEEGESKGHEAQKGATVVWNYPVKSPAQGIAEPLLALLQFGSPAPAVLEVLLHPRAGCSLQPGEYSQGQGKGSLSKGTASPAEALGSAQDGTMGTRPRKGLQDERSREELG